MSHLHSTKSCSDDERTSSEEVSPQIYHRDMHDISPQQGWTSTAKTQASDHPKMSPRKSSIKISVSDSNPDGEMGDTATQEDEPAEGTSSASQPTSVASLHDKADVTSAENRVEDRQENAIHGLKSRDNVLSTALLVPSEASTNDGSRSPAAILRRESLKAQRKELQRLPSIKKKRIVLAKRILGEEVESDTMDSDEEERDEEKETLKKPSPPAVPKRLTPPIGLHIKPDSAIPAESAATQHQFIEETESPKTPPDQFVEETESPTTETLSPAQVLQSSTPCTREEVRTKREQQSLHPPLGARHSSPLPSSPATAHPSSNKDSAAPPPLLPRKPAVPKRQSVPTFRLTEKSEDIMPPPPSLSTHPEVLARKKSNAEGVERKTTLNSSSDISLDTEARDNTDSASSPPPQDSKPEAAVVTPTVVKPLPRARQRQMKAKEHTQQQNTAGNGGSNDESQHTTARISQEAENVSEAIVKSGGGNVPPGSCTPGVDNDVSTLHPGIVAQQFNQLEQPKATSPSSLRANLVPQESSHQSYPPNPDPQPLTDSTPQESDQSHTMTVSALLPADTDSTSQEKSNQSQPTIYPPQPLTVADSLPADTDSTPQEENQPHPMISPSQPAIGDSIPQERSNQSLPADVVTPLEEHPRPVVSSPIQVEADSRLELRPSDSPSTRATSTAPEEDKSSPTQTDANRSSHVLPAPQQSILFPRATVLPGGNDEEENWGTPSGGLSVSAPTNVESIVKCGPMNTKRSNPVKKKRSFMRKK